LVCLSQELDCFKNRRRQQSWVKTWPTLPTTRGDAERLGGCGQESRALAADDDFEIRCAWLLTRSARSRRLGGTQMMGRAIAIVDSGPMLL
jgi:hypothetical protein